MAINKEVKSVLNKSKNRDTWFLDEYTTNPYSGCSFNCLYCYIRGSKYGVHMERKLAVKTNAVEVLDRQLSNRAKKGEYGIIVLASATDPYLQLEVDLGLTRQMLEVILKHRFPVHIITKSDLVERDFDLIQQIDRQGILPHDLKLRLKHSALLTFSFSTIQDQVAAIFEPGATAPSLRLQIVEKAIAAGIYTGVSLMPLLPFISDTSEQLEESFKTFSGLNVAYTMPASLTLFGNANADSKGLMLKAIAKHYPELLIKYQKFFSNSHQMPEYYRTAFTKKMKELEVKYKLPSRILPTNND